MVLFGSKRKLEGQRMENEAPTKHRWTFVDTSGARMTRFVKEIKVFPFCRWSGRRTKVFRFLTSFSIPFQYFTLKAILPFLFKRFYFFNFPNIDNRNIYTYDVIPFGLFFSSKSIKLPFFNFIKFIINLEAFKKSFHFVHFWLLQKFLALYASNCSILNWFNNILEFKIVLS